MSLRQLSRNSVIYGCGNLIQRSASFLPIPLYTHYLGVGEYGQLEIYLLAIQLAAYVVQLGMIPAYMRFYAECEKSGRLGHLMGCSLAVIAITGLLLLGTVTWIGPQAIHWKWGITVPPAHCALVCGVALMQSLQLQLNTYYRSRNEGARYMLASLGGMVLTLGLIAWFLLLRAGGIERVFEAMLCGNALIALVLAFLVLRQSGIGLDWRLMRELAGFGFPLVFAMCGYLLLTGADRLVLGYYGGLATVGVYALGMRIGQVLNLAISQPFHMAYFPYIFSRLESEELPRSLARIFTYLLLAVLMVACPVLFLARDIVELIAPAAYLDSTSVALWAIPVVMLHPFYIWTTGVLQIMKRTRMIGGMILASVALNLWLDFLWIPEHGWRGAILATLLASLVNQVILIIPVWSYYPIPYEWRRLLRLALFAAVCSGLVWASYTYSAVIGYLALPLLPGGLWAVRFFTQEEKDWMRRVLRKRGALTMTEPAAETG